VKRTPIMATLVIILLALAAVPPVGSADYLNKTELQFPEEIVYGFFSEPADENKTEELLRGGSSGSTETVNVTVLKKGSSTLESGTISFPYDKFDWTIDACYETSNGLSFYGVYYKDEKILFDYRVPWVKIDNQRYALNKARSDADPDLYIWPSLSAFKVQISYTITEKDVTVDVYCYFYADGSFDPWVYVDCGNKNRDIEVGQRFDYDLGGASDDNADFFSDSGWTLIEEEDNIPDEGNPNNASVQWRLFDTDVLGTSYTVDQMIEIIPYGIDSSELYIVRYHSGETSGDPSSYVDDEATGLYRITTYDPYIGEDLVAWYVSVYNHEKWCNPGPWTEVEV